MVTPNATPMRVVGLAGWSGAGKTTLMTRVIPLLVGRGLTVATVKHAHHDFDIDKPGKDSWLHRAGRSERGRHRLEPALGDRSRAARRNRAVARGDPGEARPVDLVIVEGFKRHAHPKLEVFRAAIGKPLLQPNDDCIVAIATDAPLPRAQVPVVMLDDLERIADVLQAEALPRDRIGPPREDT